MTFKNGLTQSLRQHKTLFYLAALIRRWILQGFYGSHHSGLLRNCLSSAGPRKMQIGSGDNVLEGWLNTDFHPRRDVLFLDVTQKLPFEDATFDYLFSEHLLEHLPYAQGKTFVEECYRVLKPGGKLRIATPDFQFLIDLYSKEKTDVQKRYIQWAVDSFLSEIGIYEDTFVINNFFRAWGHQFLYDEKTLRGLLARCGFIKIQRHQVGESADPNLQRLESHGRKITDDFNHLETMVLESSKPQ